MMVVVESQRLVGRDAVLRELRMAVDDLTRGRGRLILVTGEPGMGKSAVLRVAVELATERDVGVLAAACPPESGAPPLWCWTQLLQALRAEQAELDPWLVTRLLAPPTAYEPSTGGPDLTFRLHEAVAAALQERARTGPILVAIDDLQWADDQSVELLGFLARRLASAAVLILGTYRDAEAGPALRAVAGRAEVHALLGLDETAVGSLIAQVQGSRPEAAVAAAVCERAAGNPLFVRELTRLAMARGDWSLGSGRFEASIPDSIASTLRERLVRLSEPTREMLEVAALIGRESSAEALALAVGVTPDQVGVAAEEAVLARVLRPLPDQTGWGFVHDLYRSVLAADLGATRRAALHGAIADALQRVSSSGSDEVPAGRLAAHFLASGDSGRDRARSYALLAAADATRRCGHREAARYLQLVIRLTESEDAAARFELLVQLGGARHRAGDREAAADCFRQVARSAADPAVVARAALGLAALEVRSGTPVDDNIALLRRAIVEVERGGAERVVEDRRDEERGPSTDGLLSRLYAALARELVHADLGGARSSTDEPAEAADRAIMLAERASDGQARAAALLARHDAEWRRGSAGARLRLIEDLIGTATAADDADLIAEGLLLRSAALLELGNPEGTAELRRFVEHAEQLGHARGHWAALSRRATVAALSGNLERAASLAAEALELGREIGVPDAYGCYGTTMLSLLLQGLGPTSVELPPEADPVAALRPAMAAIIEPDVDHAVEVRSVPLSALDGSHDLESLVIAAPAFARWGTAGQRRGAEDRLRSYAGTHAVTGGCAAYYGPVDYYLGVLAVALGEHDDAHQRFRAAEAMAARLGAVGWAGLAARQRVTGEQGSRTVASWLRQGATWRLAYSGTEVHLPDAKGLRDIAALLSVPGQEVHVYTLLGRDQPALGADPVLDEEAVRQYRGRVAQLQAEIERADRSDDVAASQEASAELEVLLRELSTATGLHGRPRRLGDELERARKTVSARIHDSIARVGAVHPALGAHLEESISLGVRCSYRPAEPVGWRLGR